MAPIEWVLQSEMVWQISAESPSKERSRRFGQKLKKPKSQPQKLSREYENASQATAKNENINK